MSPEQRAELLDQLRDLKEEHAELHEQVEQLARAALDQMQLSRLKKRKLHLKDAIQRLESKLIPNLHA